MNYNIIISYNIYKILFIGSLTCYVTKRAIKIGRHAMHPAWNKVWSIHNTWAHKCIISSNNNVHSASQLWVLLSPLHVSGPKLHRAKVSFIASLWKEKFPYDLYAWFCSVLAGACINLCVYIYDDVLIQDRNRTYSLCQDQDRKFKARKFIFVFEYEKAWNLFMQNPKMTLFIGILLRYHKDFFMK